jgi:hypothetical protein
VALVGCGFGRDGEESEQPRRRWGRVCGKGVVGVGAKVVWEWPRCWWGSWFVGEESFRACLVLPLNLCTQVGARTDSQNGWVPHLFSQDAQVLFRFDGFAVCFWIQ